MTRDEGTCQQQMKIINGKWSDPSTLSISTRVVTKVPEMCMSGEEKNNNSELDVKK